MHTWYPSYVNYGLDQVRVQKVWTIVLFLSALPLPPALLGVPSRFGSTPHSSVNVLLCVLSADILSLSSVRLHARTCTLDNNDILISFQQTCNFLCIFQCMWHSNTYHKNNIEIPKANIHIFCNIVVVLTLSHAYIQYLDRSPVHPRYILMFWLTCM